jgi:glycosyltransferase involved in cell wall biosynthesis
LKISVTILAKNSEKYLKEVLQALKDFDEVLIYDNGSFDKTLEIASGFTNTTIHKGTLEGFGPTHNKASALAKHDWILSIDSDEVVTKSMAAEIAALDLDPQSIYSFPRQNFYNNKWIRWCGWHPDRQIKLYNRNSTEFDDAQVHEGIKTHGMRHISLQSPIKHYSYDSHAEFLTKMQRYSDLFAKQYCGKRKSSPCKAALHGIGAFLKAYVLKRGFLGGYEGFVISVYNGNTAFYKYLKLYEANAELKNG